MCCVGYLNRLRYACALCTLQYVFEILLHFTLISFTGILFKRRHITIFPYSIERQENQAELQNSSRYLKFLARRTHSVYPSQSQSIFLDYFYRQKTRQTTDSTQSYPLELFGV